MPPLHSPEDCSHSLCYPQSNWALWCWLLSGWACAHSRPLWVSPTTSLVRLGVSPAAAPTPMAFSIRGLRFYFPALEPWVTWSALLPAFIQFICAPMWGCRDCLRRSSHTPPVSVLPQPRESSPPRCPSPLLLPVWMNVYFLFPWCRTSLLFDFLSVLVV